MSICDAINWRAIGHKHPTLTTVLQGFIPDKSHKTRDLDPVIADLAKKLSDKLIHKPASSVSRAGTFIVDV